MISPGWSFGRAGAGPRGNPEGGLETTMKEGTDDD